MSEERHLYGYDFRSRMPCALGREKLAHATGFDTDHADRWLKDHFKHNEQRIEDLQKAEMVSGFPETEAMLVRALEVYAIVLTAAGMPIFERGRVLSVVEAEGEPGQLLATIALPVLDEFPARPLFTAFRSCMQLTAQVLGSDPDKTRPMAVLDEINERLVTKLDQKKALGPATEPICKLAFWADAPFRHLGKGTMLLGIGANSHKQDNSASDADSAIGLRLCQDKHATAKILRSAGLPAPDHFLASDEKDAAQAAEKLGWPVVVKPFDQERSNGVTTGIDNERALRKAVKKARSFAPRFLVEKHVPGICHRIMMANGKLIYVVIRRPKGVDGNGKDTIEDLVAAANAKLAEWPPWLRMKPYPFDRMTIEHLETQGFDENSVPEEGRYVELRSIPSEEWGGSIKDFTADIHPDNIELARAAADAMGLSNAGVDLMTTDITRPWHETGAIINEMNFRPEFVISGRKEAAEQLMPAIMKGKGRIPVHLVAGEGAVIEVARAARAQRAAGGTSCLLASATYCEDGEGREIPMAIDGLLERGVAMAQRLDAEERVIAGRWPDDFTRGFPVDRFETATIVGLAGAEAAQVEAELSRRTNVERISVDAAPPVASSAAQNV